MSEPGRILVVKLGALGDFIQALGPMAAIRRHHPRDFITLLTTPPFAELGRACGYFDSIEARPRVKWFDLPGWLSLRRWLRAGGFSRVYDLQNNDRSALYLRLFGRNPPEWVGAAPGASHRNADPARTAGHAFDGHVQTLARAGIADVRVDDLAWMTADIGRFGLSGAYALLVPGCSAEHPEKRWPARSFSTLAADLSARGVRPVLIGTQTDAPVTQAIAGAQADALDLTGKTALADIASLARGAALAIGNDTGPMHLIAATGCPSIALFSGHSDPVRARPKGPRVYLLRQERLEDLLPQRVVKIYDGFLSGQ